MSIKDLEAINICDQIRDRIMKEDRPLDERLREDKAISHVINLARAANKYTQQQKMGLELFAEVLAERRVETHE